MWRVSLRPEDYANRALSNFLSINEYSIEKIHDERVELRKYFTVLQTLYPLHNNARVVHETGKILKLLGEVRNYDLTNPTADPDKRDQLLYSAMRKKKVFRIYYLPVLYGSRLLLFNELTRILNILTEPSKNFHLYRKLIRKSRFISESLEHDATVLKIAAKELGEQLDQNMISLKKIGREDLDEGKFMHQVKAATNGLKEIIEHSEFYFKNKK